MEYFGDAVAALDEDRFLVGAYADTTFGPYTGAAYLFNRAGQILATFTNATPYGYLGKSIAVAGPNQIFIGAPVMEKVYVFTSNAVPINVITNPTPGTPNRFGNPIVVLSNSLVAIGAASVGDPVTPLPGLVHLYSHDGALVTSLTNPSPDLSFSIFGLSVAAVGNDCVLVGASGTSPFDSNPGGKAYLFKTNGALIATFTNPAPSVVRGFGRTVLAMGADRILIGANTANPGDFYSTGSGAVYLYHTNGTLLTTFSSPVGNDEFGYSLAVAGDLIVVGAPRGDGFSRSGITYVFKTNGIVLKTISDSNVGYSANFGCALAVSGTNQLVIGAETKIFSGSAPGSVFLFDMKLLPPPSLKIEPDGAGNVSVKWPTGYAGFALERSEIGEPSNGMNSWTLIPPPYQATWVNSNGTFYSHYYLTAQTTSNTIYRLRQP
jgi:hypothetical protein